MVSAESKEDDIIVRLRRSVLMDEAASLEILLSGKDDPEYNGRRMNDRTKRMDFLCVGRKVEQYNNRY